MTRKVKVVLFVIKIVSDILVLCWASAALAQSTRVQALYKTARMSNSTVAVSCRSGSVPEVQKLGDAVVVSCH